MKSFHKFTFKLSFYILCLIYIIGDLYVWDGFLAGKFREHFRPMDNPLDDQSELVAYVYGEPLTQNQLNRRMAELAWALGWQVSRDPQVPEKLSLHQQQILQIQGIHSLIDSSLLLLKTRANDMRLQNRQKQAEQYTNIIESRFQGGQQEFAKALYQQKFTRQDLQNRIEARLKQQEVIERGIESAIYITNQDIENCYNQIRERLKIPKRRQLQHIFLAKNRLDNIDPQQKILEIHRLLQQGGNFQKLAQQFSEDETSGPRGGMLGTITYNQGHNWNGINFFSLPDDKPVVVESKLGWHIFIANPPLPERVASLEEAKETIRTAMISIRRNKAVSLYADQLRNEAHEGNRITVRKKLLIPTR